MNREMIEQRLLSYTGVVKEYKAEWGCDRYMVLDKMIAMIGKNKEGEPIVTLKCEPSYGEQLRKTYTDIMPGYYMNKVHWNSVRYEGNVPDEVYEEMIAQTYKLILGSLSKKKQQLVLGNDKVKFL